MVKRIALPVDSMGGLAEKAGAICRTLGQFEKNAVGHAMVPNGAGETLAVSFT